MSITQLRDVGVDRAQQARLLRSGDLVSLRRGWYACDGADPDAVAAVRAGGCLSCLSALRRMSVWTPPTRRVHLRKHKQPSPCWPGREYPIHSALDHPIVAFACAAHCVPAAHLLAIAQSLVVLGLATVGDLDSSLRNRKHRHLLRWIDPALDSGIESVVSYWLRSARIAFRSQVTIPGVGRVDFLIGNRLIIEVDGREWHSDSAAFESDRARDRAAHTAGYLVIRLSYHTVMYQPEQAMRDILDLVRRREHLRKVRG